MSDELFAAALHEIEAKNHRFESAFQAGDMAAAVEDFYTDDVRYLTGQLVLLNGRSQVERFFNDIHARIAAVYIHPFDSFGDPSNCVIYQMCNTVQHLAGGERAYGHYVAAFRRVDGGWFCEMETPAMGWIGGGQPAP